MSDQLLTTPEITAINGVPESAGAMYHVVSQVGARALWRRGITGAGVNVALIDTGVDNVDELGNVVAAVDFSGESADPKARYIDTCGHGTHLAGIIAGRTVGADPAVADDHPEWFVGVAPDAGIVSIKVAGRDGDVRPEALVAALDWAAAHARDLNIGVLALAIDVPAGDDYRIDPIAAAVERAWRAGIVVVTAAGNRGAVGRLSSPAYHPLVIAVGGLDMTSGRIAPAEWTTTGDGIRNPDIAAPGAHIESLMGTASAAALDHPEARRADGTFLGSGSSQSAAVVAGLAALLRQAHPAATNDDIKAMLVASAVPLAAGPNAVGAGLVDAEAAVALAPSGARQIVAPAFGPVAHNVAGCAVVRPELALASAALTSVKWTSVKWTSVKWTSVKWTSVKWSSVKWTSVSWSGVSWSSVKWTSVSWSSVSWSSVSWSSVSWSSVSWSSVSWSSVSWSSVSWSSVSWSSVSWSSVSWSSVSWSSVSWSSVSWSSVSWSSVSWSSVSWSSVSWS